MKTLSRSVIAAIAITAIGLGAAPSRAEEAEYSLATATIDGTYYPVGVAISALVKVKLQPTRKIGMSAISSAGSGENIRLLRENEVQFAILQGLYGYFAASGTGPLEADGPQKDLRSVSMLWQNVEHFVVSADAAKTGTMADFVALKGEGAALGAKNSGAIGSNEVLLSGLGIDINKDYELVYGGYGRSAEALLNGQVKGMAAPAGLPVGAVWQLLAAAEGQVRILNFTEEEMKKADGGRELWMPYEIPAGTYPGQTEAVKTLAQPNFLAVRSDVSEENVYQITKAMYENLAFLQAIHPATKAMAIEHAVGGLPLPLHPGAVRYYQEVGLGIPERLLPPTN